MLQFLLLIWEKERRKNLVASGVRRGAPEKSLWLYPTVSISSFPMPESLSSLYHPASFLSDQSDLIRFNCPRIVFFLIPRSDSQHWVDESANRGTERAYEDQIRKGRFGLGEEKTEVRGGQGWLQENWGVLLKVRRKSRVISMYLLAKCISFSNVWWCLFFCVELWEFFV